MMNEFTKEELNDLWCGLGWLIEARAYHKHKPIYDLRQKIQSMIDNYCEHEDGGEIDIFVDVCRKCNAYLLRERHFDPE
jgi:hypothetical protein